MGNVIFCNQMCSKTHLIFKKCIGGPAWCGCMRGACQLQVVSASVQLNSVVKSWYSNPGPPEYLSAKTIGHLNFLICRKLSFGGKWRYFCLNVESEGQNKWWHSRRKKNRSWPVRPEMLKEKDYGIQQTRQSASVCTRIEPANSWMWRLHTANSPGILRYCRLPGRSSWGLRYAVITQRAVALSYQRFGPSVRNYHYSVRSKPEECRSQSWPTFEIVVLSARSEKIERRQKAIRSTVEIGNYVTLWKWHCHVLKGYKNDFPSHNLISVIKTHNSDKSVTAP